MNTELDDLEYDILNCVYFVEEYTKILEEVMAPPGVVADGLKTLINKKFVIAMKWEEETQEYKRSFIYDSDNMNAYSYMATKEGLLAHNSR
ncbi:MAG: hypothetical protein H7296_03555 [Bacteroidia bacterium]|nr:hypothetical protein [Bacteroidia bacterium]